MAHRRAFSICHVALIALVASIFSAIIDGRPCAAAITGATATLTGPAMIKKGKKETYTWTLTGSGAGNLLGTSLNWAAYDRDTGRLAVDDELTAPKDIVATDNAAGTFTNTGSFELECTTDCFIKGSGGTTDDKAPPDAQVFVHFEHIFGTDLVDSNVIDVTCMMVPEPAMFGVASITLLAAMGVSRRRRSR